MPLVKRVKCVKHVKHVKRATCAHGYTLLFFAFLTGLLPSTDSEWTPPPSTPDPPLALADTVDLVRDTSDAVGLVRETTDLVHDAPDAAALVRDTADLVRDEPDATALVHNGLEAAALVRNGPDAADLLRDAMYAPLRANDDRYAFNDLELETSGEEAIVESDDVTKDDRQKRSSGQDWDSNKQSGRRVKTGDTILNIRGAVRDAIGDAGAAPGPRASSRLDAFVIRPAPGARAQAPAMDQPVAAASTQLPSFEHELLVEAHSRARVPCHVVNGTRLRWFKDDEEMNVPLGNSGGEAMWQEGGALVIARATRTDAALWRCKAFGADGRERDGKPVQLLIYEPVRSVYLAIDGRRLDAGNTWIPVREKTILEVRCVAEGGVPPPSLRWRVLAPPAEASLDHRLYLRTRHTNHSVEGVSWSHAIVTAARELHNASLVCAASQRRPTSTNHRPPPPPASDDDDGDGDALTAKLEIRVTYPPSFVISRWPGFGVSLLAGSSAALRCDVDANPPARAWWLRDDAHTPSSPPPEEGASETLGAATLRWTELTSSHAGWYRCRATWLDAEYSSIGYYLNVISAEQAGYQPPPTAPADEEPELQRLEVPLGGSVQLTCPKGSVGCWWRRVLGNGSAGWGEGGFTPAGSRHAHGVLGIKDALYQEAGEYRCLGARAPDAARIRELKRVTLKVTGGATATALSASPWGAGWRLECGACGRNVRVTWVKPGDVIAGGDVTAAHASLSPDLAQHCWRAVLHVAEPDEMWCVAASPSGGAVAVFPRRAPAPPAPHSVRAPLSAAIVITPLAIAFAPTMLVFMIYQ